MPRRLVPGMGHVHSASHGWKDAPQGHPPRIVHQIRLLRGRTPRRTPKRLQGYWLIGSNGAVYSYGDAAFLGAPTATHLVAPLTGSPPYLEVTRAAEVASAQSWLTRKTNPSAAHQLCCPGGRQVVGTLRMFLVTPVRNGPGGGVRRRRTMSHQIHYRPNRIGMRTAQAARFAKKLNDAADGQLVAWLTISGDLAVDPDRLRQVVMSEPPAPRRCPKRPGSDDPARK
jgi:hypothetical protein